MPQGITFTSPTRAADLHGPEAAGQVTHNLIIKGNQGMLSPGTLIKADGAKAATAAETFGILGFSTDTDQGDVAVTVYLAGDFNRSIVEAANERQLTPADLETLRNKGIFIIRSIPSFVPPPAA